VVLPSLKDTIASHQLHTKKALGQHFLTDSNLLAKIVRASGVGADQHVVEIGAGPGGLTRALLATNIVSLTALELDVRCIPILHQLQHHDSRLHVLNADALKQPLTALCPAPRAVVANLPYNVGTQILVHYLREISEGGAGVVDSMTVMLQKEVADRICAAPNTPEYGRLSVLMQWLCTAEGCFDVPPSAFSPPPKVMSSIIRLVPRPEPAFPASFTQVERLLHAVRTRLPC
jgi:16S rRNA (adenine1518-N6/adenine1519-N6)-dimethyltransferase